MQLPTLYKKTSTGKIQTWEIRVESNTIHSESGQLDGKKVKSMDTINEGKNIGRSNETTPAQQAEAEALSKWTGKKKKGYVESIEDAQDDKVSELVEGGYLPMLAKVYEKAKQHIVFPCAAQPKLDGERATYTGGQQIWSRTRKEIISVPHIPKFLDAINICDLDGELYNHDYKDDFETLTHIIGQRKTPTADHKIVQYHVYDVPLLVPFSERIMLMHKLEDILHDSPIRIVETVICDTEEELMAYREDCLERGYEGAMARNLDSPYEFKRSKHLQKIKIFEDAEFEIVGVLEGRGKLKGHAGAFMCQTKEGKTFKAKMKGKLENLKAYFENPELCVGKQTTIQFQGYTNKNRVPRFPVALRIREEA